MTDDNKFLQALHIEPVTDPFWDDAHRIEKERLLAEFASERDSLCHYIEHLKRSRERSRTRNQKLKRRVDCLYLALFACALTILFLVFG